LAQNLALQREGFDVDTWKGVAGQAASEGIASLFLGGYGGAREARAENRQMLLRKRLPKNLTPCLQMPTKKLYLKQKLGSSSVGFRWRKATQVVENW
jgi:hypothetical protein